MLKKILLGVAFCLFALASAQAEVQKDQSTTVNADGNEWVKWDETRKAAFLEGFLTGSFYMIQEGVAQTREYSEELLSEMSVRMDLDRDNPVFTGADLAAWSQMQREYMVKQRNRELMKYLVRGVTNAQIKEAIDAVYADASVRHITISDAVYLAKMKASNARQAEVDGVLEYLAEGKKNRGKLKIENEKGELIKFIQFP